MDDADSRNLNMRVAGFISYGLHTNHFRYPEIAYTFSARTQRVSGIGAALFR